MSWDQGVTRPSSSDHKTDSSFRDIQFGESSSLPFRSARSGCCNSGTRSSSCSRTSKQVGRGKCNTVLDFRTLLIVVDVT